MAYWPTPVQVQAVVGEHEEVEKDITPPVNDQGPSSVTTKPPVVNVPWDIPSEFSIHSASALPALTVPAHVPARLQPPASGAAEDASAVPAPASAAASWPSGETGAASRCGTMAASVAASVRS